VVVESYRKLSVISMIMLDFHPLNIEIAIEEIPLTY